MKKNDGRKLSHEALEHIRIQAVRAVKYGKKSPEKVIDALGFHRSCIYKWLKVFEEKGWKGLRSSKSSGPQPKITDAEVKKLKKWLNKNPRQLQFDFGLWTLETVQELILRKFKKQVSISTVERILINRVGFTWQKPLFRAWQQDEEEVEEWLDEKYPDIRKEAKEEKRQIFFEDEAGFKSTCNSGKTWAEKGKRPIVKTTGARFGVNAISAISLKGELRFSLYEKSFTGKVFIDFLERLLGTVEGNITLIVDGHPVHKQKAVKEFIANTNGRLKMYFLPPYSPELNPDELVWQRAKTLVKRKTIGGPKQFKRQIHSILHSLQKQKDKLKSIFSHPDVAYVVKG